MIASSRSWPNLGKALSYMGENSCNQRGELAVGKVANLAIHKYKFRHIA